MLIEEMPLSYDYWYDFWRIEQWIEKMADIRQYFKPKTLNLEVRPAMDFCVRGKSLKHKRFPLTA